MKGLIILALKYTRVPTDTFEHLQLNAGILVDEFAPATGVIGNILGATTGGIQFSTNPEYTDFGEDIDNVPNNTKELKHLVAFDPSMSGTFLTCTPAVAKMLLGAADVDGTDTTKVVPRAELLSTDFEDVWWIGDYSDKNTGEGAGFLAVHLIDALNTSGFQIQSGKDAKGQMSFEFHGHYSLEDQETVPFEIYCKAGTGSGTLASITVSSAAGTASGDTKLTITEYTPAGSESYVYKVASGSAPTISYLAIPDYSWTPWDGTSDITAATNSKITVVSVNGNGQAIASGNTTVTAHA